MNNPNLAIIILAAGKGTRMQSDLPKVLHPVGSFPMLLHVLDTAQKLGAARRIVVVGPGMDAVESAARAFDGGCECVVQPQQLGTGDAVKAAKAALTGFTGTVLVLYGDTPLISDVTLHELLSTLEIYDVAVLGMRPRDPAAYGRLITNEEGDLTAIVEYNDASDAQRGVRLCNSGVMAVKGGWMFTLLDEVGNANAKGEYYLTDVVTVAQKYKLRCGVAEGREDELLGINSRSELAKAEYNFQQRRRAELMEGGVTMIDPFSVFVAADTVMGRDVLIEPQVFIGAGVTIGDGCHIKSSCHIEGAMIGKGATIGPFARLRPGATLEGNNKVGNFVEIKNATLHTGAQASHLSYLGDAEIGAHTNIGAGTITCNYDGFQKYRTTIGEAVFVGSNTALVAPVSIGDGAIIGAGSVITRDVPADALALARPEQTEKPTWAKTFRENNRK